MNKHTIFVDSKKGGMYSIRAELIKKTTAMINPRINALSLLTQRRKVCTQLELTYLKKNYSDDKPKNEHTIFVDSKKEGMYSNRAELLKHYCDDKPKIKHTVFVDSKKESMYSIRAELIKKHCDDKPKNKHITFVDSKKEGMCSIKEGRLT